jgi:hypothetical protein
MRHRFAIPLRIGLVLSLAACGTSLARDIDDYDLSEPSLVIMDDRAVEENVAFSYIVEIDTALGEPVEYGYPTLGSLPLVGPVPSAKPRRASIKSPVVVARKVVQIRKETAPRVRRVSMVSVSSNRKISARLPIIVGLFR